ncbi:MAG: tyrosine-type recombinase/integrase [Ignavibacteriaceae bacterium]
MAAAGPIGSITIEMIESVETNLLAKGCSKNTIASYFSKLKMMFDYFLNARYINYNPIPKRKMRPKKIVTVPEKEMLLILDNLKEKNRKHYKVIFLLLALGLRRSELVKLEWKDIDLKKKLVAVTNAKDEERMDLLPIYDEVFDFFMTEFPVKEGKVFDYKRGDSLKFFSRFLKDNGFNHYTLHTLRKTYISRLVNSGFSIFDVKTLARHKNIKTTLEHYTEMELQRIGRQISERANMGTLLGTKKNIQLKLVKTG